MNRPSCGLTMANLTSTTATTGWPVASAAAPAACNPQCPENGAAPRPSDILPPARARSWSPPRPARQLGVAPLGLGASLAECGWWRCLPRLRRVDARAGYLPDSTDQGQTIATTGGGRDGPAHVLDLRDAKGRFCFNLRASS